MRVSAQWDVGGGYVVNRTSVRVGPWPPGTPTSVLWEPEAPSDEPGVSILARLVLRCVATVVLGVRVVGCARSW